MGEKSDSNLVSYVAVFIAMLALVVSLYEGYEIRNHNRLSLKPYLDSKIYVHENNSFSMTIENAGLGPAIIDSFAIRANGKLVGNWNQAMDAIGMTKFSRLNTLSKGEIISEGESATLISLDTVLTSYNLEFFLEYSSVYEEKFELRRSF